VQKLGLLICPLVDRCWGRDRMNAKHTWLAAAVLASGLASFCSPAAADIIDLTPPANQPFFGELDDGNVLINGGTFGNWIALGFSQFNANSTNPGFFQVNPSIVSITASPSSNKTIFAFSSIGISTQTNDGSGGGAIFSFTHSDGSIFSQTVSLATGVTGLQNFTFDQPDLRQVTFFGLNGKLLQFDNLGIEFSEVSAVPSPIAGAALPGLIVAFGGLIALAWRRRHSIDRAAVALAN
jgi:hypothetical protein